jgi:hypothetical protein
MLAFGNEVVAGGGGHDHVFFSVDDEKWGASEVVEVG